MKYFQLTISSKNPGKVTEILSSMEIYSYSINDPAALSACFSPRGTRRIRTMSFII